MTVNIRVYPNKLDSSVFESLECKAGLTIDQWLKKSVPAYDESIEPLFSVLVDGIEIEQKFWPIFVLKSGNLLECFVEPKDPVTVTLVVIAVVSAGMAIYYANQAIPDTYNSTVPKGSPIYSVNAQGNQPRLMGIIPEIFGFHKVYPDYLNPVRREYIDGVEYVYMLLGVGVQSYEFDILDTQIGYTSIRTYGDDILAQKFEPGQSVSGHPASLTILPSLDVQNFELLGSLKYHKFGNLSDFKGKTVQRGRAVNALRVVEGVIGYKDSTSEEIEHYTHYLPDLPVGSYVELLNGDSSMRGYYEVTARYTEAPFSGTGNYDIVEAVSKSTELTPVTADFVRTGATADFSSLLAAGARYPLEYRVIHPNSDGAVSGKYNAAPDNISVKKIHLNFKFPEGITIIDDQGNLGSHSVKIRIHISGNGFADYSIDYSFSGSTSDELGFTKIISLPVLSNNVTVMAERVTRDFDDLSYKDRCIWETMNPEIQGKSVFEGVTTIALKIRGTNSLSANNESKVNCNVMRKLPTWAGASFGAIQPTDDIAPVVKYLADAQNLPVDMVELKRLHDIWKARGDTFSGVFDNETTAWEALKRVLAVGFAEPTLERGVLVPVRDEKRDSIEFMYTPQNMIKDSWKFSATMFDESEPDGVEVEYMDGSGGTWKSETVMCLLPGELGLNPEKIRAFGITDRNKAYQFGMRKRSEKRYRRVIHKFSTEMDGLNSSYLSYDGIAVEIPHYGKTGEVVGQQGNSLYLSEPVEFATGAHYILVRKPTGHASGPWRVVQGADEYEVVITDGPLDFTPVFNGSQERPAFTFGNAEEICERVLIKDIKPTGTDRVALTAVNDDDRVYLYDDALAPS